MACSKARIAGWTFCSRLAMVSWELRKVCPRVCAGALCLLREVYHSDKMSSWRTDWEKRCAAVPVLAATAAAKSIGLYIYIYPRLSDMANEKMLPPCRITLPRCERERVKHGLRLATSYDPT